MSNLRRERRGTRSFTTIDNEFVRRSDLSWEARGLLTYLLSLPDDWQIRMTHLEKQSPDGAKKLRRVMKELEATGYVRREPHREGNRLAGWDFYFDELPLPRDSSDLTLSCETREVSDTKPPPTNKRDIRIKEDTTKAASPLSQEGKSENPSPPVKKKSSATNLSILKEAVLKSYLALRPENWVAHKKFPKDALPSIREALEYSDGDYEEAAEVVRDAFAYAASEPWWTDTKKNLSMANVLREGRVTTFAEKQRAMKAGDATAMADLFDLSSGNPKVKIREISKRVSHSRDATEEEWYWADDDSKGRFIRPGRVYEVVHPGLPGEPGYEGRAEALSIEQIYVVMRTEDDREIRTHVRNLGRESYERDYPRRGGELSGGAQAKGGGRGRPEKGDVPARRPDARSRSELGDTTGNDTTSGSGVGAGAGPAVAGNKPGGRQPDRGDRPGELRQRGDLGSDRREGSGVREGRPGGSQLQRPRFRSRGGGTDPSDE